MLTSGSGQSDDSFGSQVAIDGLTAIVGAPHDDENGDRAGAAYVFKRDGGSWIRTKILASDGEGGWDGCHCADLFGSSVAISNDRAIIGATGAGNHYGWEDSGAAYIYQYDGSTWAETKLIPSVCDVESNQFGYSVSISGNKAIVGAYLCNMAVLYHFDGSDWVESQTMWGTSDNPSPSIGFYFGISVSISGNIAIVGEDSEEADYDEPAGDCDSAYIYFLEDEHWIKKAQLVPTVSPYLNAFLVFPFASLIIPQS